MICRLFFPNKIVLNLPIYGQKKRTVHFTNFFSGKVRSNVSLTFPWCMSYLNTPLIWKGPVKKSHSQLTRAGLGWVELNQIVIIALMSQPKIGCCNDYQYCMDLVVKQLQHALKIINILFSVFIFIFIFLICSYIIVCWQIWSFDKFPVCFICLQFLYQV